MSKPLFLHFVSSLTEPYLAITFNEPYTIIQHDRNEFNLSYLTSSSPYAFAYGGFLCTHLVAGLAVAGSVVKSDPFQGTGVVGSLHVLTTSTLRPNLIDATPIPLVVQCTYKTQNATKFAMVLEYDNAVFQTRYFPIKYYHDFGPGGFAALCIGKSEVYIMSTFDGSYAF